MKRILVALVSIVLIMGATSCGTVKSVSQENSGSSAKVQSVQDSISHHGTPMPEGFTPTHPPVVVPYRWNE